MTTRGVSMLIFIGGFVAAIEGMNPQVKLATSTPSIEDCMNPPVKKFGRECCRLPRERIWGDLGGSLNMCMRKLKLESQFMRQEAETVTSEGSEAGTSTEEPVESANAPATISTTPRHGDDRRRPHWKKPHHLPRHPNDSCFMECVFEDQGFLANKMVNKEAMLTRLSLTLGRNEPWHVAAVAALEVCYARPVVPSNGTCRSGSEEIFRCIFKHLFINCPNWLQNEYCTSLKEFYQRCPNGPPPETTDTHTTTLPEEEEEEEEDTEGVITTEGTSSF